MLVRLVQSLNVDHAMQVTGSPLTLSGMVTTPPDPVYVNMRIVPLLVL